MPVTLPSVVLFSMGGSCCVLCFSGEFGEAGQQEAESYVVVPGDNKESSYLSSRHAYELGAGQKTQRLADPGRHHQKLCIAGRGRKTVEKVKRLLDGALCHTDIKTERLVITSSVINEDLQSVTHAICCAERSERSILFSAHGEPDELTLTVNHFEKAKKRTLIIECGDEDPAKDQLYDAKIFNDSMTRSQPRLKDFIDKNCFISLSEVLNDKQKEAIMCWLGREEESQIVPETAQE